ncbi:nucleotide-binding protein [Candidatus Acetothermia bacterium]|nr:nucleotide-binding protein [Candidatus Acetothermia bacterium]
MTSQRGRKVFIVHGHDVALRESVARFLEKLELESVILGEQPEQGQTVIEKFEKHADVTYAVVLLTPDDMGYVATASSESAQPRARQNVVLELGYFMAQLGRENIALLQASQLELPSNLSGVLNVSTESEDWKLRLAKELKSVGFDIDLNKIIEQKQ